MSYVTIAGLVISAGFGAYGAATKPNITTPDLNASSKELSDVNAQMLPARRRLEAAAQQGGKTERPGYTKVTNGEAQKQQLQAKINQLTQEGSHGQGVFGREAPKDNSSQIAALKKQLAAIPAGGGTVYLNSQGQVVPESEAVIDFAGSGEADIQGKIAQEMAKMQLDLSKKYDSQFIDEALAQEKLADPEGFAARGKMNDLIQGQINRTPERPVADLLNQQVTDQVKAGSGLDSEMQQVLADAAMRSSGARGGTSGADFSKPLTTGFEGEARQANANQKGVGLLTSGTTPEDVKYREEQQNLANLYSLYAGKTPQSQFGSLSSAQNGPTPVRTGNSLPTLPGNQDQAANQLAISGAGAQNSNAMNQTNWFSGITSMLLNGASALGKSGYKPLAQSV